MFQVNALNLIVGLILLVIFLPILIAGLYGAPWVPIKKSEIGRLNKIINLKSNQKFIELGCGDGRVCRYIAQKNPSANILGIELAWPLYLLSQIKQIISPIRNLKILMGDCFKLNYSRYDVVYLFLLPKPMKTKLFKRLNNQLKKGSRVISYVFPFNEWYGNHVVDKSGKNTYPIHVYKK